MPGSVDYPEHFRWARAQIGREQGNIMRQKAKEFTAALIRELHNRLGNGQITPVTKPD